jgi:cytochrome c-type biogenesis protein CcmI
MMLSFILPAVLMLTVALLFIFLPIIKNRHSGKKRQASSQELNVLLTKQRFNELEEEIKQDLLSEDALTLAREELKVALVTEAQKSQPVESERSIKGIISIGLAISILISSVVYWQVSQLPKVNEWQETIASAGELKETLGSASADAIGIDELRDVRNQA